MTERRRKGVARTRRGATLILMTVLMTVLIGMAAFALDFGRFYMYRSQLQNAADAAAWAGLLRLKRNNDPVHALDTALAYGNWHRVGTGNVSIPDVNVIPGYWDFQTRTFTPEPSVNWAAATNNAVRATAPMTADFYFGRIFGFTSRPISALGTVAEGFIGPTPCVRPWAIPYQLMLEALYPGTAPGNPYDPTYVLSQTDIQNLAAMTIANQIFLKVGDAQSSPVSGAFYAVGTPPIYYADGTMGNPDNSSFYDDKIGWPCDHPEMQDLVGPGDWLQGQQGNMAGPTADGVKALCGVSIPGNVSFTCPTPVEIKAMFWSCDESGTTPGCPLPPGAITPRGFLVNFVGVFTVTGYVKGTGSNPDGVTGFFNTMVTSGQVINRPTPLSKLLFVQ